MARIMVVAGGDWQVPLVKKIKSMGHRVLCTNLYKNSPAFDIADESVVIDVLDKEKNLHVARQWKPDLVITDQTDIAVPTVAYISEKLGLPGIGENKARLFTDKYEMRSFQKNNGFAYPKFALCYTYEEAKKCFDTLGLNEAIIKPVDSQSSRGVYHITRKQNFEWEFEQARLYSSSNRVIFEEFLDGVEFTVDGILVNNKYQTLAISRKKHYEHKSQIASDLLFAWNDEIYNYAELERINENLIISTGLPFGLTHAEYIFFGENFYLVEMAARGGGTLISSDISPYMSGIDGPEKLIEHMLGNEVQYIENRDNKTALLHFFDFKPGKIRNIYGMDIAKTIKGVHKIKLDFKEGDEIRLPEDDRSRLGFAIIFGTNKKEVYDSLEAVTSIITIGYE